MKSSRDTRVLAVVMILIVGIYALPMFLHAAAPGWWGQMRVYHLENSAIVPAEDFAAVNDGQLKHFAISAYEHLCDAIPADFGDIGHYPDGTVSPAGVALMQWISGLVDVDAVFATGGYSGSGKVKAALFRRSGGPCQLHDLRQWPEACCRNFPSEQFCRDQSGTTQTRLYSIL